MALLISFLIGIQLFHAVASVPLPQFIHAPCNSLEVKTAAEVALNKYNKHRAEGYVLGLQRIFDACKVVEDGGYLYYFILDVLETKCHVGSQKPWKECEFRHPYETVFGQCKVIIKFNKNSNDSFMYRNDCDLQPHSSPGCPGCPIRQNASEDRFQEIARESLAKFNAENNHNHYFSIVEVTKATSQVVHGISNAIEFTIRETACHKGTPMSDITQCSLLPTETAERGLCKGSVIGRGHDVPKIVTANCELFPRLPKSDQEEVDHPHVVAPETSTEQKAPAINDHPSSKEGQEPNTLASPEEKANSHLANLPPFPTEFSQSASCPGEVAKEIPGLELPSPPQAEASETKTDVQP